MKNVFKLGTILSAAITIVLCSIYVARINSINNEYQQQDRSAEVSLRKFPYPYKAALSLSSDIDNTSTIDEFLRIQEFLNTTQNIESEPGVGLEIGNSFLMYESPTGTISYFNSKPIVAENIQKFIKAGVIDVLHSYGKKNNFTREDAIRSINELKENKLYVDVWVDHTLSIDNMGDDVTYGEGDIPRAAAYHADLTLEYGIKFAWLGRVTMINGQSVPLNTNSFLSIYDSEHKMESLKNMGKEFAKNFLSQFGYIKYQMHRKNELIRIVTLDDGQKLYEFIRFDNHWTGVGNGANADGLSYALSKRNIDRLKEVGGFMVLYTHFGKNKDSDETFPIKTAQALHNLAAEFQSGRIYVTNTSKLLNYYVNHKYLKWSYSNTGTEYIINIESVQDPAFGTTIPTTKDIAGFTFYYPVGATVQIYIAGKKIDQVIYNPSDQAERPSVQIPLTFTTYPG